ncbi:MAG TPA: ABC transporter permease [Candidatus Ornithoclostridium excrementipullorum]|nr:ABC transporter permease [Candidatus Ornithoclostridium excrementipullorum]
MTVKQKLYASGELVLRNLKIFVGDKASVFFSLLAPLIVLLLYVFFLKELQIDSAAAMFGDVPVDPGLIEKTVNNWMLAGVVSVACVTVSFSAQEREIKDRETGVVADIKASPLPRPLIEMSYFLSNLVITLCICAAVLVVALIYAAISGWTLSAGDVAGLFACLVMSALSASLITGLISRFVRTSSQHGALVGIVSAAIGFLMGAYMPIGIFPKAVQYITLFVPGTYSAALFRELFMRGTVDELAAVSPQAAEAIESAYSLEIDFFGVQIGAEKIAAVFAATIALFAAIRIVVAIASSDKEKKIR